MVDLTRDFESTSETVHEIISAVDFETQKLVILLNKTDISALNNNVNTLNYIVSQLENKRVKPIGLYESIEDYPALSEYSNLTMSEAAIIPISAKTGTGIDTLRAHLASSQRDLLADSDTTLVTNQRHIQALSDTRTSLLRVRDGLASGLPTDLASQDIREAIYHIGSIVG